ncbi:PASTA domain-containing protein [Nonomuraea bangladeshensis]|uniref:non-specific serine/threonine protein kinase n=1 Tax=Nonomuraea bangladeshensis TaxID=404385 RepID=A0ABV3H3S3_9ACTN
MPTAQPLRTGDPARLGAYELSGRLGEGGQGVVFLGARDGEAYAVKLLHGPVGDERAAFLREVELAKHVARFCTAQVIDAGFDEGRAYIVSEYVDGPSLAREVALTGPRRGGALERLAVGTATAITAIHRAGIVHRDFKPQNVLLGSDGPRVIDFGLARALDAAATVSGRGVGTPAYMAPEQITASAVTGKADVFSWAATMCFAANATAPFGQDSVAPVLHRILTAPPELGRLEGRLRTLVEACLEKDARNRPGSRELLFELLGESSAAALPSEVLATPPPHILRAQPPPDPPAQALVPEQRVPVAEPEATGTPGGYVLPGGDDPSEPASPGASAFSASPAPTSPAAGRGGAGMGLAGQSESETGPAGQGGLGMGPAGRDGSEVVPAGRDGSQVVPAGRDGSETGPAGQSRLGTGPPRRGGPGAGSPGGGRLRVAGDPARRTGWLRAALAVSVALLVTATVLLAVLVPTIGRNGQAAQVAGPVAGTRPVTSGPRTTKPPSTAGPPRQGQRNQPADRTQPRPGTNPATNPATLPGTAGPPPVTVPALTGLDRAAAVKAIKRAGLVPGAVTQADSPEKIGKVLSSEPAAGARAAKGAAVALRVSAGVPVPAVAGQQREAALSALAAAGLKAGAVTRTCSAKPDDSVIAARPEPGTRVAGGTAVALTVSREGVSVPSVVGRSRADARAALRAAGLAVRARGQVVDNASQVGLVIAQSLQAGTCAGSGAAVVLTVGLQRQPAPDPEPTATPTLPSGGSEVPPESS